MGALPLFDFVIVVFVSLLLLHPKKCALAHGRMSTENSTALPSRRKEWRLLLLDENVERLLSCGRIPDTRIWVAKDRIEARHMKLIVEGVHGV